ncbi:Benzoquinone reductase [Glomus cerebriforme]|uniref:Benzoquinone reductase n=1 Tax=Glomus cerebriforme TaxID=658196 RepID=A0A397TKN7_9GLOM|nr:Benzoquinone reductase [Glomus cerebriforme]
MVKIFIIIYYTTYTHIYQLALEVKKGIESVSPSVQVELYQVPETLSQEILDKMHAPPKPDIPIITADKLVEADGFLFGFPTRFGTLPAQFKAFLDSTGQLWFTNALNRKFAGIFYSTSSQHGGQETTAFTTVTYFAHHGIIYVPLQNGLPNYGKVDEIIGGGPWGSGTITGSDASRPISEREKEASQLQGKDFAQVVSAYVNGKKA